MHGAIALLLATTTPLPATAAGAPKADAPAPVARLTATASVRIVAAEPIDMDAAVSEAPQPRRQVERRGDLVLVQYR